MLNRRSLLQHGLGGLALAAAAPGLAAAARPRRWGVQGGMMSNLLDQDFDGTLRALAAMGYKEIGSTGAFGRPPADVARSLRRAGMVSPNNHIANAYGFRAIQSFASGKPSPSLGALSAKAFSAEEIHATIANSIRECRTMGQRYAIWPSLQAGVLESRAALDRHIALFNELGRLCHAQGVTFGIHNHANEFRPIGNDVPYDVILRETDPKLVVGEIDFYWVSKAGRDPIRYMEDNPGRFPICHIKDMAADGTPVAVGSGTLDIKALIRTADATGMKHYLVEVDQAPDPLDAVRRSITYLRAAIG